MSMIEQVSKWIELFGQKVTQDKETLNKLDTAIGDGDHGSNLTRGAAAIQEKAEETTYDNLSKLFQDVGMTLVSKVGGASGALYGSAFMKLPKKAKETEDIGELLEAGLKGIQKRGTAEVGENTMVDERAPVLDHIQAGSFPDDIIPERLETTK